MEIINKIQKEILKLFAKSRLRKKFYWTGGTALSFIYLKHRRSDDLDFFTNEEFGFKDIEPFINEIKKELKLEKIDIRKINGRYEIVISNKHFCKIDFNYYPYPKLAKPKIYKYIMVDSLKDIAANKTLSLFDRNEPKDLFDLYFIITKRKIKPKILLKLIENKFGLRMSEDVFWSEALKSLKQMESLTPYIIRIKNKKALLNKIKNFFFENSSEYLKKFIK